MAEEAGVSKGTLYNYQQLKENSPPEVTEQVLNGEVKINAAYRQMKENAADYSDNFKAIMRQFKQSDKILAYLENQLPLEDADEDNEIIVERLKALSAEFKELAADLRKV